MKLVNRETLKEMFRHFFGIDIVEEDLLQFRENFYSPAEIINIYIYVIRLGLSNKYKNNSIINKYTK
jgi:hypothetical protein